MLEELGFFLLTLAAIFAFHHVNISVLFLQIPLSIMTLDVFLLVRERVA